MCKLQAHNIPVISVVSWIYHGFVMQKVYIYNLSKLSVPCYASYQQMFDGIDMDL